MKNFYAFDTQSYFISSHGLSLPAEVIDPLGTIVASSTNYYNYAITTINLDYKIVHLDNHWEKIRAAQEKYGSLFKMTDPGYIGTVMLSYEGNDKTIKDIMSEFDIITADEYFERTREMRNEYLEKEKY